MKTTQYWYCEEIAERYGMVLRARGCYIYTRSGTRIIDMFQEAGRAILGWGNSSKAMLEFKNTMNKGLTGSFITDYTYRLEKAIKALLPEYKHVRWYSSLYTAQQALSKYFNIDTEIKLGEHPILNSITEINPEIQDLAFDDWLLVNGVPRWRPWLDEAWFCSDQNIPERVLELNEKAQDAIVVVPPLAWARTYYIIAFNDTDDRKIPASDVLLPPIMAATSRAIYDLIAELPRRSEKNWNLFDSIVKKYWERKGPYLLPIIPKEKYKQFFTHCLNCGIIISPNYSTPSIIPFDVNLGDFNKLKNNPFEI